MFSDPESINFVLTLEITAGADTTMSRCLLRKKKEIKEEDLKYYRMCVSAFLEAKYLYAAAGPS